MPKLVDKEFILSGVSPPLDNILTEQLIDEFVSIEKRYILGDWEPATLDGGQFTEAAARIIYHQDSQNLNRRRSVNNCLKYIEDEKNQNQHYYRDRKSSLHITKVIRSIYKFRSDRGAVHIDPVYTANHLDSKLVIENSRWVLGEILRIFWTGDLVIIAQTIRELLQYEIPAIGKYDDFLLVQRTDCTAEEEILLLLQFAGENGISRQDLGRFVQKDASTISNAIRKLGLKNLRQIIRLKNGNYRLTDKGIQRVLGELGEKLLL